MCMGFGKNKMANQKITASTTLEKILKKKGADKILMKFNFPCLTCPMAQAEMSFLKLGDICKNYGIDLDKVLVELNK
jgi:hypothetical protein